MLHVMIHIVRGRGIWSESRHLGWVVIHVDVVNHQKLSTCVALKKCFEVADLLGAIALRSYLLYTHCNFLVGQRAAEVGVPEGKQ